MYINKDKQLDSRSSSLVSSTGQGHYIVFLGKTLDLPKLAECYHVYKWAPVNLMPGE